MPRDFFIRKSNKEDAFKLLRKSKNGVDNTLKFQSAKLAAEILETLKIKTSASFLIGPESVIIPQSQESAYPIITVKPINLK